MAWSKIPLVPRFNIPETFGKALSYEGQIHALCHKFGEITDSYNQSLEYINNNFPWTMADPAEWSSNIAYKIYTVVYDPVTFSSYVALQDVPAGTPLTDGEYWRKTADYNAQVAGLSQTVDGIETAVSGLSRTVDGIETAVSGSIYAGKKIICVTDSWGNENSHGVTVSWMRAVVSWMKAEFVDLHLGSTGFIRGTENNNSFVQRLSSWITSHPTETADVAYVFVCGSINDHSYTHTDIAAAIATFCNTARDGLPNATIVMFGLPMSPNPYRCTNPMTYNSWMRVCYGMDYFMTNNPGRTRCVYVPETYYALQCDNPATLMDDDIHPNQAGHSRIARCAYQVLTSAFSKTLVRQQPDLRITEDYSSYITPENFRIFSNITIRDDVLDGITEFRFTIPDGYTLNANSRIALNIPHVLPVSELASATYNCLGTATAVDGTGNVVTGYIYTRVNPWTIPDNSADSAYWWMGFVNNRSLGNLSGTITFTVQWHINLTTTNGVYS